MDSMDSAAALQDGVRYLRSGALDRAWIAFAAARDAEDPAVRSEALRRLADVKRRRGEWDDALRLVAEAVQIARNHAFRRHAASALNVEATVHLQRGDFARAVETYETALGESPPPDLRGMICQNLGTAHAQRGELDRAASWYERSAAAFEEAGNLHEQLAVLVNRGNVRMDQRDFAAAEAIFREVLHRAGGRGQGEVEVQALAQLNLAESLARQGLGLEEAYDLLLQAIGYFTASGNRPLQVACHRVFARVTEAQGYPELARGALERGLELARDVRNPAEVAYFEGELGRVRAVLSTTHSAEG